MKFHKDFIARVHKLVERSRKVPDFVAYVCTLEQNLSSLDEELLFERLKMYLQVTDSVMSLLAIDLTLDLSAEEEAEVVAQLQAFERLLKGYRCGKLPKRV